MALTLVGLTALATVQAGAEGGALWNWQSITTGGDGPTAAMVATMTVEQTEFGNLVNTANIEEVHSGGEEVPNLDAVVLQTNDAEQAGIGQATAGDAAFGNGGSITAGGNGFAATSVAIGSVEQAQDVAQSNGATILQTVEREEGSPTATVTVDQENQNSQVGLVEATAGEAAVVNSGRVAGGGDGIVAGSTATASVEQTQDVDQANVTAVTQTMTTEDGSPAVTVTVDQENENNQVSVAQATAGDASVMNTGGVSAGGQGIVANSAATASVEQTQIVDQSNAVAITQTVETEEGSPTVAATVDQANENSQIGVVEVTVGNVSVTNTGRIAAGGDGIVANSAATASVEQTQVVDQANAVAIIQTVETEEGSPTVAAIVDQANENSQIGVVQVTAGNVSVASSGRIVAAGHGIVATSTTTASLSQTQTVNQTGAAATTPTVNADIGDATFEATVGQENRNSQIGVVQVTAGNVSVANSGRIVAGGDGIVARSTATVSLDQSEDTDQDNVSAMAPNPGNATVETTVDQLNAADHIGVMDVQAGEVEVLSSGDILAGGRGIVVESSINGGLGADITVTILGGTVRGGDGYFGVEFIGGQDNTLTNFGTITSLSGQAVLGGAGNETVYNYGTVTGDVDLGAGSNAFFNFENAWFNTGALVDLGGGTLTNLGVLAPGGVGSIRQADLHGNLVLSASSQWLVDLDMVTGASDHLDISGTAEVGGHVVPFVLVPATNQTFTIATATSVDDTGLAVQDTLMVDYDVSISGNEVMLTAEVDMLTGTGGLNQNQQAINRFLNEALLTGAADGVAGLYGPLFSISNIAALGAAYDQLSPEVYLDSLVTSLFAGLGFSESLMSCSARTGAYVAIRQDQCAWAHVSGRNLSMRGTSETIGADERSFSVAGGAQWRLADEWHVGFGFGGTHSALRTASNAQSWGTRLQAGASLKHTNGPWHFAGAVAGAYGWYDTQRSITLPQLTSSATSDHAVWQVTGRLRTAYLIDLHRAHLKPRIDVSLTGMGFSAFTESGGPAALALHGTRATVGAVSPALEWGTTFTAGGLSVRPHAALGATVFSGGMLETTAAFSEAPSVTPFRIGKQFDRVVADAAAGFEVLADSGRRLRVDYSGRFGRNLQAHALALKASVPF